MGKRISIKEKFDILREVMDEKTRYLWAACEAIEAGKGGVNLVANATGLPQEMICSRLQELEQLGVIPAFSVPLQRPTARSEFVQRGYRIRRPGGGRKLAEVKDPAIEAALEKLLINDV